MASFLACGGRPNLGNQGGKSGDLGGKSGDLGGKSGDLVVISHKAESGEFGIGKITGTVRNFSKKRYSYVQVEINLYDENGAQVGSTMANTNNLEPNGTWNFEAPVFERRAAKYKIVNVSGF